MTQEFWCPHCGNPGLRKNGTRPYRGDPARQQYQCLDPACRRQTIVPLTEKPITYSEIQSKKLPKARRYVITAAQNATPVHGKFLAALHTFCNHNGAELIVIPLRYKNPTSNWTRAQANAETWEVDKDLLYRVRANLNSNLQVLGDIKTQPTATRPLTGFESITGPLSGIIGHPKLELRAIATPHHHLPKIMATTGVCTLPNYTDSKAGKKGEFHHTFGAIIVELEDDRIFHMRHINAQMNGSFIDLWLKYTPEGVENAPPAGGLVMGDTHVRFIDPRVEKATFQGKDSMIASLAPQALIWHDLLDNYSRNPHHRLNPLIEIAKRNQEMHLVKEETFEAIQFIKERTKAGQRSVVVPSNHVDFMTRWIMDTDWKRDLDNAEFYLETSLAMVRSARMTENGASYIDPFTYWAQQQLNDERFIFPERDQSYVVRGIEVNLHGDMGPNGARGTLDGFRRIGVKSVIGHSHTPGIEEGCYQVGTSTHLRLEYNQGPSSWLNTHCVIYGNGKRALLNIVDGAWRVD